MPTISPTFDLPPTGAHGDEPAAPGEEKRRHRRLPVPMGCWLVDDRHTVYVRLHDLSRGGLSVRSRVPFPPSGELEVGLELPDGRWVRARGEVVWVRGTSADDSAGMGARFLDFIEGEEELYTLLGHA
jgi:hypothetical protein